MSDYNSADRKSIRAAEKAAIIRADQDRDAVASIMSTIPGRAWMWRKLAAAHIFATDFTGDALRDAFLAGERNFCLTQLLADIMLHCPDQYLQMTKEANNVRYDSNNGSSAGERRSGSIPDGGDSGSDGESAEGSEPDANAGFDDDGDQPYH